LTEQPKRSQLELYAQVIGAYEEAGFWPLFKRAYMEAGKKWRASGWFWIVMLSMLAILCIIVIFIAHGLIIINTGFKKVIFIIVIVFFFYYLWKLIL
jgi:hypothetical protein